MFTSGGQAARSKNCRRQGSASQIGIDAQFDWKSVFIVQSRLVGKGARLARRAHATLVNAGKDAWARFALPTLRKGLSGPRTPAHGWKNLRRRRSIRRGESIPIRAP